MNAQEALDALDIPEFAPYPETKEEFWALVCLLEELASKARYLKECLLRAGEPN